MIFAEVGGAAPADPVLDNADAIDIEAAHDRAARRAGREARSGDAGLAEQEVAERRAAVAPDLLVGHDRDGRELVGDHGQCPLRWGLRRGWRRGHRSSRSRNLLRLRWPRRWPADRA